MDDPPPARHANGSTAYLANRRRCARVRDCRGARPCSARTPNLLAYRSAIWRPRSSSNSPAVPRPRSRDLVIFWSAAGDLKSPPQVAGQRELASAAARPATDDCYAEDTTLGEPGRRLDPTRLAEPAGRFPHAIVGEEVVRIRALEGHDLEGRLGLDRFD